MWLFAIDQPLVSERTSNESSAVDSDHRRYPSATSSSRKEIITEFPYYTQVCNPDKCTLKNRRDHASLNQQILLQAGDVEINPGPGG